MCPPHSCVTLQAILKVYDNDVVAALGNTCLRLLQVWGVGGVWTSTVFMRSEWPQQAAQP